MKPKFSIIVPTLNSEKCIERLIASLVNQNFSDFEIIIIDAKSSDKTLEIINSFGDKRIIVDTSKDNGVYDAMNKGLAKARGDWVYFIGVDDYLYDDSVLSKIWVKIKKTKFPVIYGNVLIKGNTGWAKDGEIYARKFSKNRLLIKSICHQAIFYKHEFLLSNNLLFDLSYPVSADWHLNLRCRRLTKFKYVDIVIAVFSAGGISTIKKDSFREQIKVEFADMLPSRIEVQVKEGLKRIIRWFK